MRVSTILLAARVAAAVQAARAEDEPLSPSLEELSNLSVEELMNIQVTAFQVSTRNDRRYRASNSVSASRIDTPIIDLPFAIQAFTGEFIDDQRPENVFDVVRYSPGVTYRSNDFTEGNANVAIRGFAVGTYPGSPQILRDGLRGPSILDLTNVDRVEVVKGPASFLYGQLAPGGVVNVITKNPEPRFGARFRAAYGTYDAYRVEADATGPATRSLSYRLVASYRHDIEYWKPYNAWSADVAPALAWRPNDRMTLTVKYENFRKREKPPVLQKPGYGSWSGVVPTASDPNLSGVDVPGLPDDWNSMSFADFRDSDTHGVEVSLDAKLDEHWDARVRYGYQRYEIEEALTGNFAVTNGTFIQGRRFRRQDYVNTDHTFEGEAVGKYRIDVGAVGGVSVRALLGAQFVASSFHRTAGQAPNDPALGTTPASPLPPWNLQDPSTWDRQNDIPLSALTESGFDERTRSQDRAVYGGVTTGLLRDRLLLLGGVRYTSTELQFAQGQTLTISDGTASKFTPQLGLLLKPIDGLSLFASYAESFVPLPAALLNRNVAGRPEVPTEGKGFDAGVKADLLGGRLSGTVTFFQITNEHIPTDISELDPSSGTQVFTTVQAGKERSRGVEVDATLTPTNEWQLFVSYSYMDAKILEVTGNDAALLAQDPTTLDPAGQANYKNALRFHGAPLQMSAPHLANLWTRYDLSRGVLRGLYLAGGVNLVFDQTLLPDTPRQHHQSYALVNALVGYRWRLGHVAMSLDLMGKNLARESYRPSQSTRARPREVTVALTVQL